MVRPSYSARMLNPPTFRAVTRPLTTVATWSFEEVHVASSVTRFVVSSLYSASTLSWTVSPISTVPLSTNVLGPNNANPVNVTGAAGGVGGAVGVVGGVVVDGAAGDESSPQPTDPNDTTNSTSTTLIRVRGVIEAIPMMFRDNMTPPFRAAPGDRNWSPGPVATPEHALRAQSSRKRGWPRCRSGTVRVRCGRNSLYLTRISVKTKVWRMWMVFDVYWMHSRRALQRFPRLPSRSP